MYGIESANIVGYAPAKLQESGLTAGACFIPVTGKTFDLTELVVKGYEEEGFCDAGVQIQTLNEYGQTVKTYVWMDSGDGEFFGWYDFDTDEALVKGDVLFQAGEGLWTYSQADGYSIQSAGQVPQTDIAVTLQESGLSVANPTPVIVDLSDCYITGYEEEGFCDAGVQVQTLNEYGQTVKTYVWMDSGDGEFFGWYDFDTDEKLVSGVVPVKPGEGLWTYSQADGYNFVWPKVDIK